MAQYVDGFVLPIPKDKVDFYRSIAEEAAKIWREHGALEYRECIAEDMDAKEMVSFPRLASAGPDERLFSPGYSSNRGPAATKLMRK